MRHITIFCETCDTPLLEEELPENRRPKLILGLPFNPLPKKRECMLCFFKRADLDGYSDDPENQKLHKDFIEEQTNIRKKRFN
tara:strand:- start:642 stop:890 length:249 start_codon:yes stop_codon:yes gene_type:complete